VLEDSRFFSFSFGNMLRLEEAGGAEGPFFFSRRRSGVRSPHAPDSFDPERAFFFFSPRRPQVSRSAVFQTGGLPPFRLDVG